MAAADDVIAAIDQDTLAIYLAQKCPEEGPGAAKRKKGEKASAAPLLCPLRWACGFKHSVLLLLTGRAAGEWGCSRRVGGNK